MKLGQLFRAVSLAVINAMLAGIGIRILAAQFHVMVDDVPKGSGLGDDHGTISASTAYVFAPASLVCPVDYCTTGTTSSGCNATLSHRGIPSATAAVHHCAVERHRVCGRAVNCIHDQPCLRCSWRREPFPRAMVWPRGAGTKAGGPCFWCL